MESVHRRVACRCAPRKRTGRPEHRVEPSFDLSFRVRGTQTVSNEPSKTRGAKKAALVITAKESAHFAAHEVHGSVAHEDSVSPCSPRLTPTALQCHTVSVSVDTVGGK